MQDYTAFAKANGVEILNEGSCQFCGSPVSRGVIECHENAHHIANILDFSNPAHFHSRFLSVDALALQHSELHGPWNNHIHLTRLYLIFKKNVAWDYSKTPQLSNIINNYKRNKSETLTPPPARQRGSVTTSDLLTCTTAEQCITKVQEWALSVFYSFKDHHKLVSTIANTYIEKYYV